jgi:quinol-cytochrome oxidoreductase complex cytochrome b subunit
MAVNYKEQYRPDQLEPFWPNEIVKMIVVVLCTLAVIMTLATMPVLLEMAGLEGVTHVQEPANPQGATPMGIKPEWYFLAVYQHLRLMPTELFGISGKTLGVLSQGPAVLVILLLPFWYRRGAHRRPGPVYRVAVTSVIFALLVLTIWGGWPEQVVDGHEKLAPIGMYFRANPFLFVMPVVTVVIFYVMVAHERKAIRRIMDTPPPDFPPDSSPDSPDPQDKESQP